jgi:hypothetical protein
MTQREMFAGEGGKKFAWRHERDEIEIFMLVEVLEGNLR